jgi:hypothetical protein
MTLSGNAFPFGLRQLKIKSRSSATSAILDAAQTLKFTERVVSNELKGNDRVVVSSSFVEAVEFEMGAGGLPLEAYAIMSGRTLAGAGSGTTETTTMSIKAGDSFPWFTLYGKSMGDGADDVHVKLYKCKLTGGIDGEYKGNDFFVSKLKGIAVEDDATVTQTLTDIDVASNIATAACVAHGYTAGSEVVIAGAAASYINGVKTVISATADAFTFMAIGANVTNNTGTASTGYGTIADIVRNETAAALP